MAERATTTQRAHRSLARIVEFLKTIVQWLKEASPWLSPITAMVAAIVSGATFYYINARSGRLVVVLPDRVGLSLSQASKRQLSLVVPLTFSNTGAPATLRHVVSVRATITTAAPQRTWNFLWQFERQFVSVEEWQTKHPKDMDANAPDYFGYLGRAFTFSIPGGTSKLKVLEFLPRADSPPGESITDFDLKTEIVQDGKYTERVGQPYRCNEALNSTQHIWCGSR